MHIFIDESGSFSPVRGGYSPSVMGALVIPERNLDRVFARYSKLRTALPKSKSGEVKGKLLEERQVAAVVDTLVKNSCLFEATVIEMSAESEDGLRAHLAGQAEGITKHLTPGHYPELIAGVVRWRTELEKMALPLYVHSVLMIDTISRIINHAPLYYVQRWPKELADFHWVVDGKEVNKVTIAEEWWSQTMMPWLQSKSKRSPIPHLIDADYSHFYPKYEIATPDHLKEHGFPDEAGVDIRKLMKSSFRFSSDPEFGLELVDIVTNATRRALKGNLREPGWADISRLMIRNGEQCLRLVNLSRKAGSLPNLPYAKIVREGFGAGRRTMLTPSSYRD